MKASIVNKFAQRWRELLGEWKRLDHEMNVFARDLRLEFPGGAEVLEGDEQFRAFCMEHIEEIEPGKPMTEFHAAALLSRAIAGSVFKDKQQLLAAGGWSAVRNVAMLPRAEQVAIMQQARDQSFNINTVKARRYDEKPKERVKPAMDAKLLADYINKNVKDIPPPIRAVIARYVKLLTDRPRA